MIHPEPHPLAATTAEALVRQPGVASHRVTVYVEDWADRVYGYSWMWAEGVPVALDYAMRGGLAGLPTDDEVLYVKSGGTRAGLTLLIHSSEIVTTTEEGVRQ